MNYPIHPAAELFPMMSEAELSELATPLTREQRIADYEQALRTIDELVAEWPGSQAMLEADRNDLLDAITKLKEEGETDV